MKAILKWTGGKTSELPIIKEHMPKEFEIFVEPFLGGGAVYFNLEHKKNIVNDFNAELIYFYNLIKNPVKFSEFEENIRRVDKERFQAKSLIVDSNFVL